MTTLKLKGGMEEVHIAKPDHYHIFSNADLVRLTLTSPRSTDLECELAQRLKDEIEGSRRKS